MKISDYDCRVAVDWSARNMAIAAMRKGSDEIAAVDVPADVAELRFYLNNIPGSKILTIEETSTSQWLYTELKDSVDRILVCDPYRNALLKDGPKNDKIDASKLVMLLRSGHLKEVCHSGDDFVYLRIIASGYEDLVKAGTRLKNQRYALLRASGGTGYEKSEGDAELGNEARFVLEGLETQIEANEEQRKRYLEEFKRLARKHPEIRNQKSLPGIGLIGAVKIVARVVSPKRFATKGRFLSYSGLVKHDKTSGGRSYGKRTPRYCRTMKSVYKTGAIAAIGGNNPVNDYYEHLINKKGCSKHEARHRACRGLAVPSLGVFKSGEKYRPRERGRAKTK